MKKQIGHMFHGGGGTRLSAPNELFKACNLTKNCQNSDKLYHDRATCQSDLSRLGFLSQHFNVCKKRIDRFRVKHGMTKFAFTLAEVLITLGIIGVVAALTIPNLMAKYNRMVTANRLAKAYSTISNGIKLSENDNGPMKEWPTGAEMEMDSYWNKFWKPYFVGAELCRNTTTCGFPRSFNNKKWVGMNNWGISSDNSRILFRLVDGTIIFLPRNTVKANPDGTLSPAYVDFFVVDINGPRLPNESGKDTFIFRRNTNAGITAYTGGDCYTSPVYCAELIMQNNWKIPDDYPWIK